MSLKPIPDVVRAAMAGDDLVVRQWVADCLRDRTDWTHLKEPVGLSHDELAVAAGLVELMARRTTQTAPLWASAVGAAHAPIYLTPLAKVMPRTRLMCEREGPEPLRRRGILAPPDYLTIA